MKDLTDPTNRDTVPAMLTPGEFVLNKEASRMYAPYIEQMNNHGLQVREQKNMGGKISPDTIVNGKFNSSHVPTILPPQYNTGGLVSFLKEHEGYRDKAYQDQAGVWTIGYGRTRNPDGSAIKPNQTTNQKKEDSWLKDRASTDRSATEAYGKKHGYDWNDNQIDALASFRYNIGNLDQLTDGGTRGMEEITQMLPAYNKAGGQVSKGLQNRRNAELDLFQSPGGDAGVPAPQSAPPRQADRNPLPESYAGYSNEFQQSPQGRESFDSAFANARAEQGAGGNFQWGGQNYSTARADDEFNMGGRIPGYNIGGWLSGLFGPDEERQAELQGVADRQADMEMLNSTNTQAADQYGQQVPPPMNDLPIPNSDESLLQGSSQAVDQAKQEFVPQAMPGQQVQGGFGAGIPEQFAGGAAPMTSPTSTMKGAESVAPLDLVTEIPPYVPGEAYDARYDGPPEGWTPGQDINNALDNAGQDTYIEPETYTTPEGEYGGVAPAPMAIPEEPYEYASRQGTPEVVEERAEEIAAANEDGSGRINEEPMNFAAAAEERDVSQVGAGHHPDGNAMNFKKAAEARSLGMSDAKGAEAALAAKPPSEGGLTKENMETTKLGVTEIVNQTGETNLNQEEATELNKAGKDAPPSMLAKAESTLKDTFGDLFDKKELARAGLIFAGALLTGMSPQRALAYAGQGYLKRIDGKEAQQAKSAAAVAKASAKNQPVVDMTNSEEFFTPDGRKVKGFKMTSYTPSGVKITEYVDKNNEPIDVDAHQDASIVRGTPEYRKRVTDEGKSYSGTFKELQDRFGKIEGEDGKPDSYATDLTPSKVGANSAKWAIKNDISPEGMPQLLDNAYAAARKDAKFGNKTKNIEAYLNAEYIQAQTGSAALFEDAEPSQVNKLVSGLMRAGAKKDPNEAIQFARAEWNNLGAEGQLRYKRKAIKGQTPFMRFMG